jgi:hypothetical protein
MLSQSLVYNFGGVLSREEARLSHLKPSEIATYRKDGYVVPAFRLAPAKLSRLRVALDSVLAANEGVRPEKLVSVHINGRNAEGVVGDDAFLEMAHDPEILNMVESVLGPDIILWGCQAFCKPGRDGLEVPWHQDGQYWPIRPLANCTVWIAIDDSVAENGCLRVAAGSHHGETLYQHERDDRERITLTQAVTPQTLERFEARDVELEAGQMSLHDVYLLHGSKANTSPHRRAGLAIRYMPATSLFDRSMFERSSASGFTVDFSTRPLWLMRGEDRTGKNDFSIGH